MRQKTSAALLLLLTPLLACLAWRVLPPGPPPAPAPCANPRVVLGGPHPRLVCDAAELAPGISSSSPGGELRLTLGLPLDLNQATAQELRALPRVGPVLSQRIVDCRRRDGPFGSVAQLVRVRGIGARTMRRLAPHLRVDGDAPSP